MLIDISLRQNSIVLPPKKIDTNKIYRVVVRGWPMLQGLETGEYKIKFIYTGQGTNKFYVDFYKLKGRKLIVRHRLSDIFFRSVEDLDNNSVVFVGEYTGSVPV